MLKFIYSILNSVINTDNPIYNTEDRKNIREFLISPNTE